MLGDVEIFARRNKQAGAVAPVSPRPALRRWPVGGGRSVGVGRSWRRRSVGAFVTTAGLDVAGATRDAVFTNALSLPALATRVEP